MKKFLSMVSLVLVTLMLLATPAVAAESGWTPPEGIKIYYAENVTGKSPSIDGTIEEGEYGKSYRIDTPVPVSGWSTKFQETPPVDPTQVSEYVDFYFAYDEDNYYIAIYEMGPKEIEGNEKLVPMRSNYSFNFGFDLNDITSFFNMEGFGTNSRWAKEEFHYIDQGSRVSSPNVPIYGYDLISECIVKKTDVKNNVDVAFGDLVAANGNANYTDAQCALTIEFKFDKEVVAEAVNQCYFTNYKTISDAMYFSFTTNTYGRNEGVAGQWWRWAGQTDMRGHNGKFADYGAFEGYATELMMDLIVFAPEGAPIKVADPEGVEPETEPVTTEPAATEPAATEPAATEPAATEPAGDDTPETEPAAESGCGSSVSFAGLALVAALGTCTVFVAKKKED